MCVMLHQSKIVQHVHVVLSSGGTVFLNSAPLIIRCGVTKLCLMVSKFR